jgi:hypothetical protein
LAIQLIYTDMDSDTDMDMVVMDMDGVMEDMDGDME